MTVTPQAYVALEESLSSRLLATWEPVGRRISREVVSKIGDKDWDGVDEVISGIDLTQCLRGNIEYANFIGGMSLMFGVSRLASIPSESAYHKAGEVSPYIGKSVGLMDMSLRQSSIKLKERVHKLVTKERDRITVQKADLIDGLAEVLVKGGGKPELISSLHTSRLAQFGYTVEATLVGQETYIINEVLDARTCQVCVTLDGEIFGVRRLQERLIKVFNSTTVDELKRHAPWPKQSKAELERLESMTSEELVLAGYNSPPYHPLCRGFIDYTSVPLHQVEEIIIPNNLGRVPIRPRVRDYKNLNSTSTKKITEEYDLRFSRPEGREVPDAARAFMAGDKAAVNELLREGVLTSEAVSDAAALEAFVEGQELTANLQLFKNMVNLTEEQLDTLIATAKQGTVITDAGFTSASLHKIEIPDELVDSYNVRVRILARRETKAAYLPKFDDALKEPEVLFAKGTRYRVISTVLEDDNLLLINLEVY